MFVSSADAALKVHQKAVIPLLKQEDDRIPFCPIENSPEVRYSSRMS